MCTTQYDVCVCTLYRGAGNMRQHHLILGTQKEKDAIIEIARDDIRMMHHCQTTKQACATRYKQNIVQILAKYQPTISHKC